uniref:Uncharacterized protein n=1 Tax=Hanusia phi TaxID=3032 RepID=A0A7S0HSK6_9CRYP|mmetsp:Transcript_31610/g.71096  ORF Transcript_31610/g.71096 Transcript_31610/m.71096 type:complete len:146 (+) Transcript_31610:26-463(+)
MAGEGTSGVIKVPWGRFFEVSRDRMREASPEPSPPCNPLGDKRKSRPLKERGSPISEQSFTRKRLKDAGRSNEVKGAQALKRLLSYDRGEVHRLFRQLFRDCGAQGSDTDVRDLLLEFVRGRHHQKKSEQEAKLQTTESANSAKA